MTQHVQSQVREDSHACRIGVFALPAEVPCIATILPMPRLHGEDMHRGAALHRIQIIIAVL